MARNHHQLCLFHLTASILSKEELQEIAYGVELSMVNFIWVVRFPQGEKVNLQIALPKGFLDSIGDRGMVVEGWAPQKTILKHSSIGGFESLWMEFCDGEHEVWGSNYSHAHAS